MNFQQLVLTIQTASNELQRSAAKAVNVHLTIRNWLVGFYIVEFEQKGEDRAEYGSNLFSSLSIKINIKGLAATNLKQCRQFYLMYRQMPAVVNKEVIHLLPKTIRQTLSDELILKDSQIRQALSDELQINESKGDEMRVINKMLTSASFSHFVELIKISDENKRKFYELLILKTTPSVRELQRQINTLTYERFGLSADYKNAFAQIQQKITPEKNNDIIKSHYFFEFLNINRPELIEETELEQALTDHLQQFILELGNGFCFEARQKRLLIGDEYFFIDLVFYHRILKCHVLIDLKIEKANHEHIGQLKTYINYYKKNFVLETDNPPVGILLVTDQNTSLVEYAIADSDKDIFVSKYLLQLPSKKQLTEFIENELKEFL